MLASVQILLINGYAAGSKSKKDILDKLRGTQLFDPTCCVPEAQVSSHQHGMAASAPGIQCYIAGLELG
jgi:hypothetical protein